MIEDGISMNKFSKLRKVIWEVIVMFLMMLLASVLQLAGFGSIDDIPYQMDAQIISGQETRIRINSEGEALNLILCNGKIYDSQMKEQKVSQLFAKMVVSGLIDPFFVLEILAGERTEVYEPYMTYEDNVIRLLISPEDCMAIYENWSIDFPVLDNIIRQTLAALEATVEYKFIFCQFTGDITKVEISSQHHAPELRKCNGLIRVQYLKQPPSS